MNRNSQVDADQTGVQATTSNSPLSPLEPLDGLAPLEDYLTPYRPAPGSMQARLLSTTEGNRNNIMSLTISDAGFVCPEIKTASVVGRDGSVWRVQCSEAFTYFVSVDEFGRLWVLPIPYGDMQGSQIPRRDFAPEDRTIYLPETR